MLNPEEAWEGSFANAQQLKDYRQAVQALQPALQKSQDHRNHSDQTAIHTFLQLSPYFKQLAVQVSHELARDIVRASKVYVVQGRKRIFEKGDRLQRMILPLLGNFFVNKQEQEVKEERSMQDHFDELIDKATIQVPLKKKTTSLERRMTMLMQNTDIFAMSIHQKQLEKCRHFCNEGMLLLNDFVDEKHSHSLYSKDQTWLLGIPVDSLRHSLREQYERRLMKKAEWFRKLSCFDQMDDHQLCDLVERICLLELKKDQFVFKEGDSSDQMYLFIEGEAKAQKTVDLFKEDPNALYHSQYVQQTKRKHKPTQFAYADFQGVYNYTPLKKRMQLGIISPVTVFGQEQIIAKMPREADIQITSTKAKLFVFTLNDIEAVGQAKKIDTQRFMHQLYETITHKRILARRQCLSNSLHLENKRNMDYFYLQVNPNPAVPPRRIRTAKERINNSLSPSRQQRPSSPVKPRYHNFNFNEFLPSKPSITPRKLTAEQKKIAGLTHASDDIAAQVASEWTHSQQTSYHHNINISSPLFDPNYFKAQRRAQLRITNKKRMQMLAVTPSSSRRKSAVKQ